jgi:hypothetical protein
MTDGITGHPAPLLIVDEWLLEHCKCQSKGLRPWWICFQGRLESIKQQSRFVVSLEGVR